MVVFGLPVILQRVSDGHICIAILSVMDIRKDGVAQRRRDMTMT